MSSVLACLESKISIVSSYCNGLLLVCFSSILRPDPLIRLPKTFPDLVASAVLVFAFWYVLARWRAFFLPRFFVSPFGEDVSLCAPVGGLPPLPLIPFPLLVAEGRGGSNSITLLPPPTGLPRGDCADAAVGGEPSAAISDPAEPDTWGGRKLGCPVSSTCWLFFIITSSLVP